MSNVRLNRRGKVWWVAIVVMVLAVLVLSVWAVQPDNSTPASDTQSPTPTESSHQTTGGPDRVKSSNGTNGDTNPSSDGTGPGSSNSFLGQ